MRPTFKDRNLCRLWVHYTSHLLDIIWISKSIQNDKMNLSEVRLELGCSTLFLNRLRTSQLKKIAHYFRLGRLVIFLANLGSPNRDFWSSWSTLIQWKKSPEFGRNILGTMRPVWWSKNSLKYPKIPSVKRYLWHTSHVSSAQPRERKKLVCVCVCVCQCV